MYFSTFETKKLGLSQTVSSDWFRENGSHITMKRERKKGGTWGGNEGMFTEKRDGVLYCI